MVWTDSQEVLAKPPAREGQRPRCPRFAVVWATRTLPLPGFASASPINGACMYFLKHPSQSIFASQKSNLPITSVFQLQPKSHNLYLPKHTSTANKQCSLFINYGHSQEHLGIDLEKNYLRSVAFRLCLIETLRNSTECRHAD